jgi:hypothetical protein
MQTMRPAMFAESAARGSPPCSLLQEAEMQFRLPGAYRKQNHANMGDEIK